jgi:hypothetical protein
MILLQKFAKATKAHVKKALPSVPLRELRDLLLNKCSFRMLLQKSAKDTKLYAKDALP